MGMACWYGQPIAASSSPLQDSTGPQQQTLTQLTHYCCSRVRESSSSQTISLSTSPPNPPPPRLEKSVVAGVHLSTASTLSTPAGHSACSTRRWSYHSQSAAGCARHSSRPAIYPPSPRQLAAGRGHGAVVAGVVSLAVRSAGLPGCWAARQRRTTPHHTRSATSHVTPQHPADSRSSHRRCSATHSPLTLTPAAGRDWPPSHLLHTLCVACNCCPFAHVLTYHRPPYVCLINLNPSPVRCLRPNLSLPLFRFCRSVVPVPGPLSVRPVASSWVRASPTPTAP